MAREHMKSWQVGDVTVTRIVELWDFQDNINMTMPEATAEEVIAMEWLHPHYATPDGKQRMNFQGFVVQAPGRVIVVDSCIGAGRKRDFDVFCDLPEGFLEDLESLGISREDVDTVMCTHLHFDHVGWNTRLENGRWVPTFPNARYVFGRRDFEYFKSNPQGEELHHEAFLDSIAPVMEAGQADIVDEAAITHREIGDGVWLEPAFGHSPGCCTVNAQAGGQPGIFWGDVIHHPVQLIRHDLPFAFDADGATACRVRKATMERVADSDTLCFPAHFRRSSAGYVKRDGDAFRYEWIDNT